MQTYNHLMEISYFINVITEQRDLSIRENYIHHTNFKGTVHTKIQNVCFFHLACQAVYPSRMFWCELLSFGAISCRDAYLF